MSVPRPANFYAAAQCPEQETLPRMSNTWQRKVETSPYNKMNDFVNEFDCWVKVCVCVCARVSVCV